MKIEQQIAKSHIIAETTEKRWSQYSTKHRIHKTIMWENVQWKHKGLRWKWQHHAKGISSHADEGTFLLSAEQRRSEKSAAIESKQLSKLDIYCSEITEEEIRRSKGKLEKKVKTPVLSLLHTHSNKRNCLINDKMVSFWNS